MVERDPTSELKDGNARLIALLEASGIQWRVLREPLAAWLIWQRSNRGCVNRQSCPEVTAVQ